MKIALIIVAVLLACAVAYLYTQNNQLTLDRNTLASEWDNIALGNAPSLYNQNTKAPAVTLNTLTWTTGGLLALPGTTVAANTNPFTGATSG